MMYFQELNESGETAIAIGIIVSKRNGGISKSIGHICTNIHTCLLIQPETPPLAGIGGIERERERDGPGSYPRTKLRGFWSISLGEEQMEQNPRRVVPG